MFKGNFKGVESRANRFNSSGGFGTMLNRANPMISEATKEQQNMKFSNLFKESSLNEGAKVKIRFNKHTKDNVKDLTDGLYNENGIKAYQVGNGYAVFDKSDLEDIEDVLKNLLDMEEDSEYFIVESNLNEANKSATIYLKGFSKDSVGDMVGGLEDEDDISAVKFDATSIEFETREDANQAAETLTNVLGMSRGSEFDVGRKPR